MIYDAFLFYNELDLLEIRLNTLNEVVDKFVIVEATVTHTNKPKELYYQKNKKRFKKFSKKIIHVIIDDSPPVSNPWILERYQFTQAVKGLSNCKPDDIILHGPVDEIPNPKKILEWAKKPGKNKVFLMDLSYYYLNLVSTSKKKWEGTHMFKFKDLLHFKDIYYTRYLKPDAMIENGGWHFSYIGDVKKIQLKMSSMAHQEYNNSTYNTPEKIQKAMAEGKDLFGIGRKFKIAAIDSMPDYVKGNQAKFSELIVFNLRSSSRLYFIQSFFLAIKSSLRVFYRKYRPHS